MGLWVGIWALCTTSLSAPYVPRYAWLFAGASPLMTYFLLRKVSGVPPLEVREYSICRWSVCALCGLSCVRSQWVSDDSARCFGRVCVALLTRSRGVG